MLIHFYDFNFLMRCLLPRTSTHKYCIYPRMTELALHCRLLLVPYFLSSFNYCTYRFKQRKIQNTLGEAPFNMIKITND